MVVRWEADATQPLPWLLPKLARVLQGPGRAAGRDTGAGRAGVPGDGGDLRDRRHRYAPAIATEASGPAIAAARARTGSMYDGDT